MLTAIFRKGYIQKQDVLCVWYAAGTTGPIAVSFYYWQ